MAILWILLTVGLGSLVIYTAFPLVYLLDGARKAGVWIPRGPRIVGYLWAVLAPVGNLIHNVTVASFIFRDWPRELATSGRIQRYVDQGEAAGWRYTKALRWARFLNYADPGHIKGVPDA